jgi:hypothetical protein
MVTNSPNPPNLSKPLEDRYLPGDPIPAPEVTEADSESVWALFSETPKKPEDDFPETNVAPLQP